MTTQSAYDYRDIDFWRNPIGVAIEGDPLKFLYVTDEAEHMMISWLAQRFFEYQREAAGTPDVITKLVMITMGALLPGVLLHDYIGHWQPEGLPKVEFGTFGVQCYIGPGQPLEHPEIVQPLSVNVNGHTVGVVEDLIDLGMTLQFVHETLTSPAFGARDTVIIAAYRKRRPAWMEGVHTIIFGECPQDTWIITPRERVETMIKRTKTWARSGATRDDCLARLRQIGYPNYLLDDWFDAAWLAAAR
jgi:hypoxanthine phosphoribosyltransferase